MCRQPVDVEAFDAKPKGTVVSASPAPGEKLKPGTKVALVVSKGPELLAVPDVVGKKQGDAEKALAEAGFAAKAVEAFSDSVDKGVVISQDPAGGRAPRDSTVTLTVSKGPQLITVPDLVGKKRKEAEERLKALGLKPRVYAIPGPGTVRSTNPSAGAQVRKGSTVTVYVF